MKENYVINIVGLCDSLLSMNKEKLKNIDDLLIEELDKNDVCIKSHNINKNELSKKIIEIFNDNVSSLKEISIYYYDNSIKQYLTGIEII